MSLRILLHTSRHAEQHDVRRRLREQDVGRREGHREAVDRRGAAQGGVGGGAVGAGRHRQAVAVHAQVAAAGAAAPAGGVARQDGGRERRCNDGQLRRGGALRGDGREGLLTTEVSGRRYLWHFVILFFSGHFF